MQLRPDALDAHLAKSLSPIYTIHGDEGLLVQEAVDRVRAAARAGGFTERDVLSVERSFDWGALANAGQSMSLFGDRKLIELRIPGGKPGKEGGAALKAHAEAANGDVLTIITLPRLDAAASKSDWFTALDRAGVTVKVDPVDRARLPDWIAQRLAAQGQRVEAGEPGRRVLQFIADRVEGNLLAAHQEIQKLGLLYPEGVLTFEQVQDAVLNVARYDVFKLSEAVLAGDAARLVRMLDGLRGEGEAAPLVLWALTEEVRTLAKITRGMAAGKPLAVLLREFRVWGPRERLMEQAAGRATPAMLAQALQLAARLDRQVKGLRAEGLPGDPWDGMLQLGLLLAGERPPGARSARAPRPVPA
ncbi:DNA polymerase III subunit delta [Pandoraea pnomenusa]|jgi:DNA polymerase-3 subunit delta|uniref:DNA polymerase III subunit delta n=1 Tax=Pandoraea pnomenusa TaxID=93220 RepID=A0ABY6WMA6_9BURK|nr:DNA polymerase III subunit delta [Pandoraea pnomenusa]ANC44200.1 DNA polymerase III subunit delta [Pandoraea pnomenusa]MBN9093340.1 DNA polymerase III subunit delta [Pandoraea pnomenusa]QDH61417.1 DNA polymerase III subunit delta [Pandoraea pnomenusa]QDX23395.1 DNA polymerase III subunit delta [Pandoraea pnomenusa]VVE69479.1 DNA polymerase III subunit delta [Pandoraea pnomenusa]